MKNGRNVGALLTAVVVGLAGVGTLPAFGAVSERMAMFVGFTVDGEQQYDESEDTYYTLVANSNTINSDGEITVAKPVRFEYSSDPWSGGTGITIVMKYKNLSPTANASLITTSRSQGTNSGLGCYVNTSMQVKGVNSGGTWTGGTSSGTIDASGYLVYVYHWISSNASEGTTVYFVSDSGTASTVFAAPGLKYSDNNVGQYVCLGGTYAGNMLASGMVIEGVSIYKGYIYSTSEALELVEDYEANEAITMTVTAAEGSSVSAINAYFAAAEAETPLITNRVVSAEAGATITVDTNLVYDVTVKSSGNVTLTLADGESLEDCDIFRFDFSKVTGSVLRSWLTDDDLSVIGFNFNALNATDTTLAYETGTWIHDTTGASGSSTNLFSDGISKLSWSADGISSEDGTESMADGDSGTFVQGYLSSDADITLTAVPYETYDVILYSSASDGAKAFTPMTVNGTSYTWNTASGAAATGTAEWGYASEAQGKAVYGLNTLRVNNLTGKLTISSGADTDTACGTISAIQIMPAGTSTAPKLVIGGDEATTASWTDTTKWEGLSESDSAPTSGAVIIELEGTATLTIDTALTLGPVTISGTGTLTNVVDTTASFTASSLQSAVPVVLKNDIAVDAINVAGGIYYDYVPTAIRSRTCGAYYLQGAGASTSAASLTLNEGTLGLMGGTFYYPNGGMTGTNSTTTVTMSGDATIDLSAVSSEANQRFNVGNSTYNMTEDSRINTTRFLLSSGGKDRAAVFTMTSNATVNVTGRTEYGSVDSADADIAFGHFNGPSAFTQSENAIFAATNSDILVGKQGNTQTITLNGGRMTVQGIKLAGNASGTNTLTLNGGELQLGSTGIDSYSAARTMPVTVSSDSTISGTMETVPITQAVTVDSGATLTLANVAYEESVAADASADISEISDITISLTNALTCAGNLTVRPKVNVKLGSSSEIDGDLSGDGTVTLGENVNLTLSTVTRPTTDTAIDMAASGSTLTIWLTDALETMTLTLPGIGTDETSRVVLYDQNGNGITTVLTEGIADTDEIIISADVQTFYPTATDGSLSDTSLWSTTKAAVDTENFNIVLKSDATLTLDSSVTDGYGHVYVTRASSVAEETPLTLTVPADFLSTMFDLGDNVVLCITNGTSTTYATPIRGTGSVTVPAGVTVTFTAPLVHTGGTRIDGVVNLVDADLIEDGYALGDGFSVAGGGQIIITDGDYITYRTLPNPQNRNYWYDWVSALGVTFTNEIWTGTVTCQGYSLPSGSTYDYGYYADLSNAGSVLEFDGVADYLYPSQTVVAAEIRLCSEHTATRTAGGTKYTSSGLFIHDGISGSRVWMIGKLTGDGPIFMKGASPSVCLCIVGDVTEWTGTATTGNSFRLLFAANADEALATPYDEYQTAYHNSIAVSTNVVINGAWSTGWFMANGTAVLNMTSNSSVTASSKATFTNGVQVVLSDTKETAPATLSGNLNVYGKTTIEGGALKVTGTATINAADAEGDEEAPEGEIILNSKKAEFIVGVTDKTLDADITSGIGTVYNSKGRAIKWFQVVRKIIGSYRYHYLLAPGSRLIYE